MFELVQITENTYYIESPAKIGLVRLNDTEVCLIDEGARFDLGGGRVVTAYYLPGHTPGSIVLLLKEDRILFSGDAINHHLWLQLDESMPVCDYVEQLDKVMFLQEEADYILHGHTNDFDDISLLRCMRQGCMEICAGKTQKDVPCKESFEVGMQHEFALEPGKHYQREDSVICYSPQRVNHK